VGGLGASDFSGGEATVARALRGLGFEVVRRGDDAEAAPGIRRNPPWAFDELLLALDLYLREGQLDDSDARVLELSEVLNELPIHTVRPDLERFRNPNGVALKLANFAALDPGYPGVGMTRGGRRDAEVWDLFSKRRAELAAITSRLRGGVISSDEAFPVTPEDDEDEVAEGRLLFRQHRSRERNRALVERKKSAARAVGRVACEVCGFDFEVTYGVLGHDFIECHHVRPLSDSGATMTKLADLVLLCANCHRMAHRGRPWPSLEDLRSLVRSAPGQSRPPAGRPQGKP
jgi:5-methylcytosine-specific restriction protein A